MASVADCAASSVASVNGRRRPATSCGHELERLALPSRYFFSRQLLSVAPAVVKMARTVSVSTTMSRARRIGDGAARDRRRLRGGVAGAGAVPAAGRRWAGACLASRLARPALVGAAGAARTGFGAKYAWYSARTTNDKKDREKDAFFHEGCAVSQRPAAGGGTGSIPGRANGWQRATRRSASHKPRNSPCVSIGLERVRRTRRLEAARAAGERTEQQLIRLDDDEADADTRTHHLPRAAQLAAARR